MFPMFLIDINKKPVSFDKKLVVSCKKNKTTGIMSNGLYSSKFQT